MVVLCMSQVHNSLSLDNFPLCVNLAEWQNVKATSVLADHSLLPTTHIIPTPRWLTADTITTKSPAQSSSAAALTR